MTFEERVHSPDEEEKESQAKRSTLEALFEEKKKDSEGHYRSWTKLWDNLHKFTLLLPPLGYP